MKIKNKELIKEMFYLVGKALFDAQSLEKDLAFLILFPEIVKNRTTPSSEVCAKIIEHLNKKVERAYSTN